MRTLSLVPVLVTALVLTACGGGGGGGGAAAPLPPAPQQVVITSIGAFDGYCVIPNQAWTVFGLEVGDRDGTTFQQGRRSFVGFGHATIPNPAVIQSVVLRVYVHQSVGDPTSTHGPLVATHVDVGPTLEAADVASGVIQFNVGTLSADSSTGWKSIDVTSQFGVDVLAGRTRTQFRLELRDLDRNDDGQDDILAIESGDNGLGTNNLPELIVTYTIP